MGRARDFGPDVVLDKPAFVHPSASLHGRVRLGEGASVWANAVIRAEVHDVDIGVFTNIQDFVMVHVDFGRGVRIGPYCSITHHAVVHGSSIGANCLIGLNATIMDGCTIGDNCVIGAGALVREGTRIPADSIAVGVPARIIGPRDNFVANRVNAFAYYRNALGYAAGDQRVWASAEYAAAESTERARLEAEHGAETRSAW